MHEKKLIKLVCSVAICHITGIIGASLMGSSVTTWYEFIEKPFFTPPNWLFGPTWIALYTLMGISLYLVWEKGNGKKNVQTATTFFMIHLIFNAIWSGLFFGLQMPLLALLDIIILLILIFVIIIKFYKINKWAAYLLFPYLIWIGFATALTFAVWQIN